MNFFTVRLRFHGDLTFFLKSVTPKQLVERQLKEKSSIKDVIESCGVPHPEVDVILLNGEPADFLDQLEQSEEIDVYPVAQKPTLFPEKRLQERGIVAFIADGHLGKLVRDMRLLGFDVSYDRDADDRQLIELTKIDNRRALLTRDRRLLMHSVVRHGYYLRSQDPLEQTIELIRRFELETAIDPFTRCLRCNAPLEKTAKSEVLSKLEPLTKIYYEQFRRCTGCSQVYWAGSHFLKLQDRVKRIRQSMAADGTFCECSADS